MQTGIDIYNATDDEIMAYNPPTDTLEVVEDTLQVATAESDTAEDSPETAQDTEVEVDGGEEDTTDAEEAEGDEVAAETTEDAQGILDKLFSPFAANGKDIQVDNIEDARRLMQMGAGFNKKMTALKPHLKLIKMLKNNDLLDEGKLTHLIDIANKNPAAIGKLLAESNIDPLNLTPGTEYTPNSYTVSDEELELEDVASDLKESPHFSQTIDIAVTKWDSKSKEILINQPQLLRVLHDQVAGGIYDQVTTVMDKERTLGRLVGMSDIEAYKHVGDMMEAKGLFKQPANPAVADKQAIDLKLKSRKLAASPTKSVVAPKKAAKEFNLFDLSDEEIMAMSDDKFN